MKTIYFMDASLNYSPPGESEHIMCKSDKSKDDEYSNTNKSGNIICAHQCDGGNVVFQTRMHTASKHEQTNRKNEELIIKINRKTMPIKIVDDQAHQLMMESIYLARLCAIFNLFPVKVNKPMKFFCKGSKAKTYTVQMNSSFCNWTQRSQKIDHK